ncbi:hypothetical protein Pcinc_001989 [Petrolisthes cinctipes]|uniref:Claspin n=1 Tax=Petrolisthes cinctipes TaxID=88211 RepID=A0AAE1GLT2_PETCI|nr:hypothetical protein Pcinc_001989 [Petrolisthes cinctipes]
MCKKMAVADDSDIEKVYLDGEAIEVVEKFCYLGNTIGAQGGAGAGVMARVKRGWSKGPSTQVQGLCEDNLAPTQDIGELMGLCSGQFSDGRGRGNSGGGEERSSPAPPATPNVSGLVTTQSNTEEDLLGLCTARFPSQAIEENSSSTRNARGEVESEVENTEDKAEEVVASSKLIIFSSDEEDPVSIQTRIKRRKKRKRIMELSDDEDAQHGVEFDDEENEIPRTVFTGFKDKLKGGIRADFLEKEAELSGSDYNSADEEEFGDDDMEEEEGDHEQFDENELRNQVGRAHLKTVLDSDKREIRLLQEMYLEDGELHGEGRQRQFRWKNLNGSMEDKERRWLSDNEEENEEELEDAEWRKQRFEREKYLKEQKSKIEDEGDGELFKLKLPTIVRSSSIAGEHSTTAASSRKPLKAANPIPAPPSQPTVTPNPFSIMSKRGSFLSRDKATLERIAEITKDKNDVVGGAKQAGNFVFQQLSAEEVQATTNKLKRTQSVPSAKKARLDRSFFSMDTSKQSSSIFKYL